MYLIKTLVEVNLFVGCVIGSLFAGFMIGSGWAWNARGRRDATRTEFQAIRTVYGRDLKGEGNMYQVLAGKLKMNGEIMVKSPEPDKLIKRLAGILKLKDQPEKLMISKELIPGQAETYKLTLCEVQK